MNTPLLQNVEEGLRERAAHALSEVESGVQSYSFVRTTLTDRDVSRSVSVLRFGGP